jgi:hypothetical protein
VKASASALSGARQARLSRASRDVNEGIDRMLAAGTGPAGVPAELALAATLARSRIRDLHTCLWADTSPTEAIEQVTAVLQAEARLARDVQNADSGELVVLMAGSSTAALSRWRSRVLRESGKHALDVVLAADARRGPRR